MKAISTQTSTTPGWRTRGRAVARTPIARGSAWILASTIIAAIGGALFWLAAARTASTTEVGTAAALFSSVAFVNYATGLGLPFMVARYGGGDSRESRVLFNWAVAATVVSSVVVTVAYLPFVGGHASSLYGWGFIPGVLFFAVVAAGGALSQIVDMRLTVQRRWRWVTARIAMYSIMRFPLLLLLSHRSDVLLFAVAAGLPGASGFVTWWFADPREGRFTVRPTPPAAGPALRFAGVNCLSQLAVQAPVYVLPVIVLSTVSSDDYATFFVAWSIAMTLLLLPVNVVKVLLAEGTPGQKLARQTRLSLALNGVVGLVAAGGVIIAAGLVTTVYGSSYAKASHLLPPLALAVLPWALTVVAMTHARVIDDERATLLLSAVYAVSVLAPSFVLVHLAGTTGAAQGWLAGNCATAIVAATWLRRQLRREADATRLQLDH